MIENKNRSAAEDRSIQVAEDSRELAWKSKSFTAGLYMGQLDLPAAFPFPRQDPADAAIGDEVCARVDAWLRENLDGEAIDREGALPPHVLRGLTELGLWAIKIPQEYGGLGLSQTNYMRVLATVGLHCGSTAATLSAHQSIGVPQPLKLFGTPEQKARFLPRFARGEISAFALTEAGVGSDPANLQTHAELSADGTHWVLNGEKLWCTNGVIADLIVVMARTPDAVVGGRTRKQITAFIVETDWEGVEVLHRCRFMGLRAIENGILRFTDVRVPVENVVGEVGGGLRLALTTLNDGRLGIPAISAAAGEQVAGFMARWAASRSQWGKPIGAHQAGSDKLAFISGAAFAMDTLSRYSAALSDKGDVDLRMEAAAAKLYNSELNWELLDTALQLRGGRGYETAASLEERGEPALPLERALRDARINRIVEGTSDVMHLFLAREALDEHLRLAAGFFQKGGNKLQTLWACARFYPAWYARLWVGGLFRRFPGFDGELRGHLRWIDARVRKLGRALFHRMALRGPKLEMEQNTLARIVDLGAELLVMSLVASRLQTEQDRGETANQARGRYWLRARRHHVDALFASLRRNADADAVTLARALMADAEALPPADTSSLRPMARERGRDLTQGAVRARRREEAPRDGRDDAAAK
jgi:alkylation response protein AidB-like acyl-CoA dehydrogenase